MGDKKKIMNEYIIDNIVKNIGIRKNEIVLLHFWGENKYIHILNLFGKSVVKQGGIPCEYLNILYAYIDIFEDDNTNIPEKYYKCFEPIDIVIDIFCQPLSTVQGVNKDHLELKKDYLAKMFLVLKEKRKVVQIRMATVENAGEVNIDSEVYINNMNAAFDVDCNSLKKACEEYIANHLREDHIVLKTYDLNGKMYKIFFSTEGRKWHIDAGDGDWPCGEIYIAPNEKKTNGKIYFPTIYMENGTEYKNVIIEIRDGEFIHSNNNDFEHEIHVITKEKAFLCELGIGMNPNITKIMKYAVLDEKAKGTFHIGFGDNTMFGGKSSAKFHFDLVNEGRWIIE